MQIADEIVSNFSDRNDLYKLQTDYEKIIDCDCIDAGAYCRAGGSSLTSTHFADTSSDHPMVQMAREALQGKTGTLLVKE